MIRRVDYKQLLQAYITLIEGVLNTCITFADLPLFITAVENCYVMLTDTRQVAGIHTQCYTNTLFSTVKLKNKVDLCSKW